jgi:multidrug efflux system membrane fusion protein
MSASTHPPVTTTKVPPPSGIPPKKKRHTGWIWLLVALAIAGLAWYMYVPAPAGGTAGAGKKGGKGGRGIMGDIPVAVAKAHRGNIPVYLDGLGNVQAFYTVNVRTRVDGQLMNVAVKEGDLVKEGELIAQVDPRPFQVMLEQAEGTMARDQALLSNARTDLTRYQTLLAQDAIPKQQLDTQRALVAQYEGNIKTDQANIDNAKLQLTYAKVTAPITGRIGLRQVDPGNIVHASDANGLVVITQLQPISIIFTIPEDNLPQVLKKLRAASILNVDAFNRDKTEKLDTCKLVTVDNSIDPQTGTSKLKAVCPNNANTLFPNQFTNVRLLVDNLQNQILVPEVAVQQGSNGNFVYVVGDDAKVKVQPVQTGITEGNNAQIVSGLEDGEAVVIDGADKLQAGSKVRIRDISTGRGAPGRKGKKGGGTAGPAESVTAPPATPKMSGDDTGGGKGQHKEGYKGKKNQ